MSQFKVEVDKLKNKCSNCHGKGFYYIAINNPYIRYRRYPCELCKGTGILSKE